MSKWAILGLAAAVAASAPARADKPAQDEKAVAVIKKGIEALGGAAAVDKYPASKSKVKGSMSVMGLDLKFTGTSMNSLPDKLKVELDIDAAGQSLKVVQLVNGKTAKVTMNGQAAPLPDGAKEELMNELVGMEVTSLTPLLKADRGYALKAIDDIEIDGKKASGVLVSGKPLKDKEWKVYFDQKTGLMVRMQRRGMGPDGMTEVDEETTASDYKKVSGVMQPMKLVTKHDGNPFMTMEFTEVELLEKIDAKEFATDD